MTELDPVELPTPGSANGMQQHNDGKEDHAVPAAPSGSGLLFGRVVRPPRILWEHSPPRSARLASADVAAVGAIPGVVEVVIRDNFAGVVATSEAIADQACTRLRVKWALPAPPAAKGGRAPAHPAVLTEHGDAGAAMARAPHIIEAAYRWPFTPPASASACQAIAAYQDNAVTVWTTAALSAGLRTDLAALLGLGPLRVTLVCLEPGHESRDDPGHAAAAADAALLSQVAGRPVKVSLTAEQGRIFQDPAYLMTSHLASAVDNSGAVVAYTVAGAATPPGAAPLALVLTGTPSPIADVPCEAGHGAIPPYAFANLRVTLAPAAGAAPVADPAHAALLGRVFAHESHLDEIAAAINSDPVELRLKQLDDQVGAKLIRNVARQAGWAWQPAGRTAGTPGGRRGRGFAYASVVEADDTRDIKSWSAWVVDVDVDTTTGDVSVARVVLGHDAEHQDARRGTRDALENEVHEATRKLLSGSPAFDAWDLAAAPHAGLPAPLQAALPTVEIVGTPALAPPVLRGNGSAMLPAAAAVANAIFDATGVRLREPPFSAERVRLALEQQRPASAGGKRKRNFVVAGALLAAGVVASVLPWRSAIAPVSTPMPGLYSAMTIERGRLVAAAGDCVVCHTAPNGTPNAGGLPLETPFGTIYSTNITPDPETGIGAWSFAAFDRAMRQGIHRDGKQLYPAFPYTAFARVSENDMQSLYAYLMSQPAVRATVPETKLDFPFNMRPMMAGWNLLFNRAKPFTPTATQSVEWNRGAYLAEGLGHCSACHTPRNVFGAEKGGKSYLTGAMVEGWEAPPLTALSKAPVPWTEDELFRYLRFGYSPLHGPAAGPMAPVIKGLAELPESDVRAIAVYVASFNPNAPTAEAAAAKAQQLEQRSQAVAATLSSPAARTYDAACAVCHQGNQGTPLFGTKPSLALNTNLHSALPDNLIQVLIRGIEAPPSSQLGYMPGFGDSMDDQQITELTAYLRARFAPDQPAWTNVDATVKRVRAAAAAH
jgi:nicotinate dehydrogenase subunit B